MPQWREVAARKSLGLRSTLYVVWREVRAVSLRIGDYKIPGPAFVDFGHTPTDSRVIFDLPQAFASAVVLIPTQWMDDILAAVALYERYRATHRARRGRRRHVKRWIAQQGGA